MWPNPQFPADLVTFTEEIINGKFRFLCSGRYNKSNHKVEPCDENREQINARISGRFWLWKIVKFKDSIVSEFSNKLYAKRNKNPELPEM